MVHHQLFRVIAPGTAHGPDDVAARRRRTVSVGHEGFDLDQRQAISFDQVVRRPQNERLLIAQIRHRTDIIDVDVGGHSKPGGAPLCGQAQFAELPGRDIVRQRRHGFPKMPECVAVQQFPARHQQIRLSVHRKFPGPAMPRRHPEFAIDPSHGIKHLRQRKNRSIAGGIDQHQLIVIRKPGPSPFQQQLPPGTEIKTVIVPDHHLLRNSGELGGFRPGQPVVGTEDRPHAQVGKGLQLIQNMIVDDIVPVIMMIEQQSRRLHRPMILLMA
ncbi:hypothetical protein SDC9_114079 [bioreactor metagenome]|uniref:Uncharacterized protein n=1 Tax=bioreactor metagenome TaxID=1076179 RepID=A0A645BPM8_9ZZZZ